MSIVQINERSMNEKERLKLVISLKHCVANKGG